MCKRAHPDLQLTVAFLTTRVECPDKDDWKKLVHMLEYINSTIDLILTLGVDSSSKIYWWEDLAYVVHTTCRSHTGYMMSIGKGSPISTSRKQKLHVTSSTEAELVAADDCMSHLLWTNYFLEQQGIKYNTIVLYQDNKSAILLEKNGKASTSKHM